MSFWLTQAALRAYSALRSISSSPTLKYHTVLKRGQTQMEHVQAHFSTTLANIAPGGRSIGVNGCSHSIAGPD